MESGAKDTQSIFLIQKNLLANLLKNYNIDTLITYKNFLPLENKFIVSTRPKPFRNPSPILPTLWTVALQEHTICKQ